MARAALGLLRPTRTALDASGAEYDPEFAPVDQAMFSGPWSWLGEVAGPALDAGPFGQIDDDVSYLLPWGCDPAEITAPALIVHGGLDRIIPPAHARWLAAHIPAAELVEHPADSHISILGHAESTLDWLRDTADGSTAYPLD